MKMELRSRAIDKIYKRRDRVEMPEFQREEVWSADKKRKLIDSILRGWHLPKFYFRAVDAGSYDCVDGQQRLVAIWEFFDNKLTLAEDTAKEFGGKLYRELPENVSDAFDDFEIDIEELEDASEQDLEELFLRLQLGTPLNTAEKLNAVGGELRDFAKALAAEPFFEDRIALRDTRFAHFVLAVQWLFVEARGVQPQMRFPQLEGMLRENRRFSSASDLATRAKKALAFLAQALPTRTVKLRNRANVLSVLMLASRVVNSGLGKGTAPKFGAFLDRFFDELADEVEKGQRSTQRDLLEYQEAISYGSTGGSSVATRLRILTRRLVTMFPEFAPLLGDEFESKHATEDALADQVSVIEQLIYTVNEGYAATHGEDLFKLTNRSAAGLQNLGSAVRTPEAFGSFIDGLYFLVYEGSGSCKRLPKPVPEFAMDVKAIRTNLRHDLDHGPSKDAGKKRREKAAAFRKYSGKGSLTECAPEDLLGAQLRLLDGLRVMLESLAVNGKA